jgi:tellurite resistance protein TerC
VISLFWIGLLALLVLALALDLGVFHRDARAQSAGEAALWSLVWISTALAFNVFVYFAYEHHWLGIGFQAGVERDGTQAALEFLTAWVIEESLSLDNIFIIATVLAYFRIPPESQYRLLYWGVLGALVMRCVIIVSGLALVQRFTWTTYLFGGLLLVTAVKMMAEKEDLHPERNALVRLFQRWMPLTHEFQGTAFFTRGANGWNATPMFLALLVVESSDLLFAVDSLPAVIAVTSDPFIAFSSNAFAILGLRSLYFVIAPLLARFHYMKQSLIFLLAFIGVKMLLTHHEPIPTSVSLAFIVGILSVGILASLVSAQGSAIATAAAAGGEPHLQGLVRTSFRTARRVVIGVVGGTIFGLGVAMLVLPGPALIVVPIGLAILATEFIWAHRWLDRVRGIHARLLPNPAAPRSEVRASQGRGDGQAPLLPRQRILLVEDSAPNRKLTLVILKDQGHAIYVAENGRRAVEACEIEDFDVVLMDIQMPEMDGFQATAAIRKAEAASGRHVPIIAMTAHALQGDRAKCLAAGIDDYIAKPIRRDDLFAALARAVGTPRSIVDWSGPLAQVDGNREVLRGIVDAYVGEIRENLQLLPGAVASDAWSEVRRYAHTLKSAMGMFGVTEAQELAQQIEGLAADQALAGGSELFARLEISVELVLTELAWFVETGRMDSGHLGQR